MVVRLSLRLEGASGLPVFLGRMKRVVFLPVKPRRKERVRWVYMVCCQLLLPLPRRRNLVGGVGNGDRGVS